jgi:hypothetical protein
MDAYILNEALTAWAQTNAYGDVMMLDVVSWHVCLVT